MSEFWKMVLAFICGGGGLALINVIQERWKWRADRKATKEDREEEKEDKLDEIVKALNDYTASMDTFMKTTAQRFEDNEKLMGAQSEALKLMLLDRILYLGQSYISRGEVSFDARKRLGDMHSVYHNQLGGNGDADAIMDGVYNLPLAK